MSTLSAWLLSIPTLIIVLFCMQDFDGIISATYSNNWAEYLVQTIGPKGAVAILSILWVDSTCATASCFMSAQRVTFAISRDGVLPFSKYFRRLNKNKIPVNAAFLVTGLSIAITCAVIGSSVAFTAITATATIVCISYQAPGTVELTSSRPPTSPTASQSSLDIPSAATTSSQQNGTSAVSHFPSGSLHGSTSCSSSSSYYYLSCTP
jgi:hypothetical protein